MSDEQQKPEIVEIAKNWWVRTFQKTGKVGEWIFGGLMIAVVICSINYLLTTGSADWKNTVKKVDAINQQIDTLRMDDQFTIDQIKEIKISQIYLYHKLDSLNLSLGKNTEALNKLKKEYHEKIKSVDNYTIDQLDSFFANRYRDYYPAGSRK